MSLISVPGNCFIGGSAGSITCNNGQKYILSVSKSAGSPADYIIIRIDTSESHVKTPRGFQIII